MDIICTFFVCDCLVIAHFPKHAFRLHTWRMESLAKEVKDLVRLVGVGCADGLFTGHWTGSNGSCTTSSAMGGGFKLSLTHGHHMRVLG